MEEEERDLQSEYEIVIEGEDGEGDGESEKEKGEMGKKEGGENSENTRPPPPPFSNQMDKVKFLRLVLTKMKCFKQDMMTSPFPPSSYPPVAVLSGISFPTPKNILYQGPMSHGGFDFDTLPFGVSSSFIS